MLKKNRVKKPKMSSEQNTWDFKKKIYIELANSTIIPYIHSTVIQKRYFKFVTNKKRIK